MSTFFLRIGSIGFLFLLIFLLGYWMHSTGKPYHLAVFTLHKLISIGAVAFLTVMVIKTHQSAPLQSIQVAAIAVAAACFLATIISGGLISIEKPMPDILLRIHQIIPYVTVISIGWSLYLLFLWSGRISPA